MRRNNMFLYNDLQATIDSSINFVVNKFSETKHYKKDLPVYISAYYTVICEVVFKEEIITNNLKKHFTENYCKDESTKDFYLSIISDFSKVIDDECDWVGQSCYEIFNEEAITNLRQKPFNRLLLLLCDFLTFSSITAKRYKLESFKPLIIIDNIEAIYNVKSFLPDIITHFIDGFDTLHKYNEQFQDVLTNGGVAVLKDLKKSNTTNSDALQTKTENSHNTSNSQNGKKTSKFKTKETKKAILKSGLLGVIFGILITLFIHNLAGGSLNTEYYFAIFIVTVFFTIVARISLLSCD